MEIQTLINDLNRRFQIIMDMKAETLHNPLFYSALAEYMAATRQGVHISEKFHMFDHTEHDKFENEVCQKIMHDESIPEPDRPYRVFIMMDYYFAPMYDTLEGVGNRIKEQQGHEHIQFARSMTAEKYRDYLRHIHPAIIAVLESDLTKSSITSASTPDGIFYDPLSCTGFTRGSSFRFKDQKPNAILFGKLYEKSKLTKEEIWEIIGHEGNTIAINNLAVDLRKRAHLTIDDLVLSNNNWVFKIW